MIPLLLASSLALADSEVGTDRKFGLGVEFGNGTFVNVSGKYWLSEKNGIAFHAGTSFVYHEVGGRFESVVYEGHWFDWADVPIWWWAGIDAGIYTSAFYTAPQLGVSGGAAAALHFAKFPGEVFVQAGIGVFPLNYCSGLGTLGALCIVQGRGTAGFRYYF